MTSTNSASITIGGNSGFKSIRTDDGITNRIILNNFSEISDLITLNNSNFNNIYILINYAIGRSRNPIKKRANSFAEADFHDDERVAARN